MACHDESVGCAVASEPLTMPLASYHGADVKPGMLTTLEVAELASTILEHLNCGALGRLGIACSWLATMCADDTLWSDLCETRWRLSAVQRRVRKSGESADDARRREADCATKRRDSSFHSPFLHGARSWRQTYQQPAKRLQVPPPPSRIDAS